MRMSHSTALTRLTAVVAVLAGLAIAAAEPLAFTAATYTVRKYPGPVTATDMDRDGILDLVVLASGKLTVLHGLGDGSFANVVTTSAGRYPEAFAIADVDVDGWPDIAILNMTAVTILRGSAGGPVRRRVQTRLRSPFLGLSAGDLDDDGLPDLVVGRIRMSGDHYDFDAAYFVVVLRGLGDGRFETLGQYDAKRYPSAIVTADFDRDGRLDMAVSDNYGDGAVLVRHGLPGATFSEPVIYPSPRPGGMLAADLNLDGWPDLALVSADDDVVAVFYGGPGGFASTTTCPLPDPGDCIGSGDMDQDGRLDLVVYSGVRTGAVQVLFGQPDGSFAATLTIPVAPHPRGLAVADVNGDGRPDLAVSSYTTRALTVLLNQGVVTP